jgi:hypothetical protein
MAVEPQSTAPSEPEPPSDLAAELAAEHGLVRAIVIGTLIATPLCILVWMGLIALALSGTDSELAGPLAMGAGIGVLTGLLFGSLAGFVSKTHTFDELDRQCNRRRSPGCSPNP